MIPHDVIPIANKCQVNVSFNLSTYVLGHIIVKLHAWQKIMLHHEWGAPISGIFPWCWRMSWCSAGKWLFCYYFMHSLEIRFFSVVAPREGTLKQNVFLLSMLSFEIRFSWEKVITKDKL